MTDGSSVLAGIVILAGGASKRMGSPKAQLTLPSNETLLDYHVQHSIMLNVPIMIADLSLMQHYYQPILTCQLFILLTMMLPVHPIRRIQVGRL